MGVQPDLTADMRAESRPWWESRLCLALVVLATTLPLLYPAVNPTILFMADNFRDYRAHILSVMLRRTF